MPSHKAKKFYFQQGLRSRPYICVYLKSSSHKAKIVNEYDQEIPQSQTADNPVAPRGRAAQPSRDTRKTN